MIYFGKCNSDGSYISSGDTGLSGGDAFTFWTVPYTAPSNLYTLTELSAYCRLTAGTGSIRLALYNAAGTVLIGQTGIVALAVAALSWMGQTSLALSVTPATTYIIALAWSTSSSSNYSMAGYLAGTDQLESTTHTYVASGFPASLPSSSSSGLTLGLRAGGNQRGLLMRRRRRWSQK